MHVGLKYVVSNIYGISYLEVHTWTGLDAGCPEGVLGIRVGDHPVGFGVVEHLRRTCVLTGSIIIKVPAGLDRKASQTHQELFTC